MTGNRKEEKNSEEREEEERYKIIRKIEEKQNKLLKKQNKCRQNRSRRTGEGKSGEGEGRDVGDGNEALVVVELMAFVSCQRSSSYPDVGHKLY